MLAILCFLHHIITFYNIQTTTKKKIYSNNKGLIQWINVIKQHNTIRPRQTMLSESDVELQIHDMLRIINTTAILHHVMGHQDDSPTETERTW